MLTKNNRTNIGRQKLQYFYPDAPENPVANTECFIWNEKSWQGFPSPNPIATECGLHSCILCNSGKFSQPDDLNFSI